LREGHIIGEIPSVHHGKRASDRRHGKGEFVACPANA
jgi:hypothetical protein